MDQTSKPQQHLSMPALNKLHTYFKIDQSSPSGLLRIKASRGRNGKVGPVLSKDREGYYRVKFKGVHYRTHRIIYFMHTGEDPSHWVVDHADGDISNNCVENLRRCSHVENLRNARKRGKGDLPKGISKLPNGMYRAQVTLNSGVHYFDFASLSTAGSYLDQVRKRHHGEFARN